MTYFFQTRPDISDEMMGTLKGLAERLFLSGQWDNEADRKSLWDAIRKQQMDTGCGVIASECWANCALEIMDERVSAMRAFGASVTPQEARQ